MPDYQRILVVQTAFPGDVILTLPMIQLLKRSFPSAQIDIVVNVNSADLLKHHPAVSNIFPFDKRGTDSGLKGLRKLSNTLRERKYEIAIVPHRSIRSALIVVFAGIARRVGFDKSAGWFLFTDAVHYEKSFHEVERNISLLNSIGIHSESREYPQLYPSDEDVKTVDRLFSENNFAGVPVIAVAPGTVWNTKRWPAEHFTDLTKKLIKAGHNVVLVGGSADAELCETVRRTVFSPQIISLAGKMSFLQSAELIRRSKLLISNDSAPMHLAVAMQTPVVAIFGATIPGFGFAPYGKYDRVVETLGLDCRPCSIHGGDECPVKTFYCMKNISAETVFAQALEVMKAAKGST